MPPSERAAAWGAAGPIVIGREVPKKPVASNLDPAEAGRYHRVAKLSAALGYATNEAARRWLNGETSREDAKAWLVKYSLATPERAEQQMKFIERYRSYVINYNVGLALVRGHVKNWDMFRELLSTPMLPSNLR